MIRVGIDATPVLGDRTGIGRYIEHLLRELAGRSDVAVTGTCFSLRGRAALAAAMPAGVDTRTRPAPANLLQRSWMRSDHPSLELASGVHAEVFHGPNFILPPSRSARGVVTVHDLTYLRYPELVDTTSLRLRTLVPRGLRRAAVVVVPSQATADDVRDAYGIAADRIAVTPLGVEPSWFTVTPPTREWLAAQGLPSTYLLAVGTVEPRKGLDILLDAYRQLLAEDSETPPLVLAGATGWGPALDRAGLPADAVVEAGWLDQAALRQVVAGARVLAFPSRYEGFGLPPLEALAAGVPVVASDLAVTREVLGPHAHYAPVGAVEELAGTLRGALTTGGPTPEADRRAHAATFTWQACADATVAAYRRALA